ncbi:MAG TPA: hypothetical protein VK188_10970 [Holophaga sp.]|nr:hypothetical protein [Holophaga sp.]
MLRINRWLATAGLWALLSGPPLTAQVRPLLLPTRGLDPIFWDSFISCVDAIERFVGPRLPEWVVRTFPFCYTSRRPLYDQDGRPRLDGEGRQATEPSHQSGRIFLPPAWRAGQGAPLPLVVYSHATTLAKSQVPSTFQGHEWVFGAAAAAYFGFAVVMPDQPGMGGDGGTVHPYLHRASLAHAVVDALGPAREALATDPYATANGYGWDGRVFLVGYSEGGFAALAAAREMEERKAEFGGEAEFQLAGTACLAAPVDLSGAVRRQVADRDLSFQHPFFLPYLVAAWHAIYGPLMDPHEVLHPRLLETRNDGSILQWLDGTMDGVAADGAITRRMGARPGQVVLRSLLNPVWAERNLDPPGFEASPLKRLLEENDVAEGWAPSRPILFAQSLDDREVPPIIARNAMASLGEAARRAGRDPARLLRFQALAREGSGIGHVEGVALALPVAFEWIGRGAPPGSGAPPSAIGRR